MADNSTQITTGSNHPKIDDAKHRISSVDLYAVGNTSTIIKGMIKNHIEKIIAYPEHQNKKFYIGKTDNCEKRLQEHEQISPVKKMFVFTDYVLQDRFNDVETQLLSDYKDKHPRCNNVKGANPPSHHTYLIRHIYLIIWEEEAYNQPNNFNELVANCC